MKKMKERKGFFRGDWKKIVLKRMTRWKSWRRFVTVMSMIMVFVTTYALILPAITLEKDQGKAEQGIYLDQEERGSTVSITEDKAGAGEQERGQNHDNTTTVEQIGLQEGDDFSNQSGQSDKQEEAALLDQTGLTNQADGKDQEKDQSETSVFSSSKQSSQHNDESGKKASGDSEPQNQIPAYANKVYTVQGDGYKLSLDLKEEMGFPADVTLSVEEIKEDRDTAAVYRSYMTAAKRAAAREGRGEFTSVRFIKFALFSDGKEVRTNQDIDVLVMPTEKDKVRNGDEAHVLTFRGSAAHMVEDVTTEMSGYRVSAYRFFYPSAAIDNRNWGLLCLAVTEPKAEEEELMDEDSDQKMDDLSEEIVDSTETLASTEESGTEVTSTEETKTEETATEETSTEEKSGTETNSTEAVSTEENAAEETATEETTTEEPATEESADESTAEGSTVEENSTEEDAAKAPEDNRKLVQKLEYKGEDYQVVMTCDDKAGVPEGATLQVTEIRKDTDSENYEKYLQEASETLEMNKMANPEARFFDIKIMDGDQEIEPKAPVSVNISYDQPMEVKEGEKVDALHFGEKETEVLEDVEVQTNKNDEVKSVTFDAESFSVYGVLTYTVDFTFDGYSYSIEGDSTVKLSKLVETLEIAGEGKDYETGMDFVKDVKNVTFTDESLVKVEKAGLFGTGVFSWGDWELISLKPFDTEETLTIVMEDGIRYEIKVTDAQMKKTVIGASGETYEITVTYGEEAEIPEGAELYVKEILPEDKDYQKYFDKALEKAEAQAASPV